jgi:predicted small secreted protein
MRASVGLVVVAVWLAVLSGCNTIKGIGRDIEAAGNAIQRSTR